MITIYLNLSSFKENIVITHSVFRRFLTNLTLIFNTQLLLLMLKRVSQPTNFLLTRLV